MSNPIMSTHRYISRRYKRLQPNSFFVLLEDHFQKALVDGAKPLPKEENLYVCQRLTSYPAASRQALLNRMPSDIANLVLSENPEVLIDILELDLVDFLLHYDNNRVLIIIGSVGIGKTTFINHVLFTLRRKCLSLQHIIPIVINCLGIGTNDVPVHLPCLDGAARGICLAT
jgi:hypothetical protein